MLNYVKHTVTDGLLGISSNQGTGIHIKIGASPTVSAEAITILGSMGVDKIRNRLGYSPLADSVMDAVENGANRIICIPVTATTSGTISEAVEDCAEDSGEIVLSGKPYNAFQVVVQITGQGVLNTALFKYSINGGYSYSQEITVPLSGKYEIESAGLAITFSVLEGKKFNTNDTVKWTTTAPQMTNSDVLAALDQVKNITTAFEFIHIVGESQKELWSAVSSKQTELQEKSHKNAFVMLEAYAAATTESIDDYVLKLEGDKKNIKNYNIQVCAARGVYTGMDGITRDTNLAGIVTGLYGRTAVNKSIGETAVISIGEDKLIRLLPEGITEEQVAVMDGARYLTFRQYDGLDGYYVTNANMMCPEGSDYRYAEDVRVLNKVIRMTRKEALLQLQADIDMEDPEGDLAAKAQFIQAPIEDMITAKEISSVSIIIPTGQDILATETLHIIVRYVPHGKIRAIEIDVGVNNPYAA